MAVELMTLEQARAVLREEVKKGGATCPCCQQHVQIYKRSITSSMAAGLVQVLRYHGHERPFDPLQVQRSRGLPYHHFSDFTKLRYWGLITTADDMWRVTAAGIDFVLGHGRVQKYAVVYNGDCQRLTGDRLGIRDALKKKFDLDELLGRSKASAGDAARALNPTGRLPLGNATLP